MTCGGSSERTDSTACPCSLPRLDRRRAAGAEKRAREARRAPHGRGGPALGGRRHRRDGAHGRAQRNSRRHPRRGSEAARVGARGRSRGADGGRRGPEGAYAPRDPRLRLAVRALASPPEARPATSSPPARPPGGGRHTSVPPATPVQREQVSAATRLLASGAAQSCRRPGPLWCGRQPRPARTSWPNGSTVRSPAPTST